MGHLYEWKAVTLLGLGFGLVGLDRWIIAPLFPFMLQDLGLNLQDQGSIIGILGMAWGVFAIFSGRLSDSIGHRKVLIPAILLFSLLSGVSGMATGFASLFAIRLLMGVMEGSVLSNELRGDGCCVLSEPARVPPGTPAVRVRAVWAGSWTHHRDAVATGRALMALGIRHRRHSRRGRRRPLVPRPA